MGINNIMMEAEIEQETFADYGEDFQERVVQALFLDFSWAEQMQEIIKIEYFEIEYFKFLVKTYYSYYANYKTFPTLAIMASIIKEKLSHTDSFDEILLTRSVKLLKKIKQEPDLRDLPYVKNKALDFCKQQAMKEALFRSTELIAENQYDEVIDIMKNALTAGEETAIGHDFDNDKEARFIDIQRDPVPLGVPELDRAEVLAGGLGRGELGIFVAAPSVGKSHWLVQVGASALESGYNVLHISLEMSETKVGRRYDGWFTGINNREIPQNKDFVIDWYEKNKETMGRLFIKEFPSGQASANTLRTYIQKLALKKNFKPDVVVVDYADEMCSIKKFDSNSSRHEFKAVYRDLRNLAREFNCAVWSASQSNKEGSSAEIVTGENMSESYRKLDVPDFVFTGACRPQDKAKGIMKGFTAKNRDGRDGDILPMHVDKTTSRFRVITEEEYVTLARSDEDQENELKQRLLEKLRKDKKDL